GAWYQFEVWRRFTDVQLPRRSVVARVLWRDAAGKPVLWDTQAPAGYARGQMPRAEPEYPVDDGSPAGQWGKVAMRLQAPPQARMAVVELYLQWAAGGQVAWSGVKLEPMAAPGPRRVRLATVHFRPKEGKEAAEKVALFEPLVAQAAQQRADLVVLPESLTYYGTGRTYAECAEPVPGPSTKALGEMAKRHHCYLVAGLLEREGEVCYNTAALIAPDGSLAGKYRKVCLPRSEIEGGLTPGSEYPVFDTPWGRVGMMICYDGFFPEVARQLKNAGAEVIAWPVWGCNPLLGRARACENQVYLVSSTYTDAKDDWMVSAVFDPWGQILGQCQDWGTVSVTEVDLNARPRWASLGNFGDQLPAHRPPAVGE
ncbi:MAG: carbon-nitrogen hydrolase family protein, partial [Verrucomicrobiales bacterium]|nr:carbon-nitrogen hydrolase family protein [Verrucomicrobiales bacterium]